MKVICSITTNLFIYTLLFLIQVPVLTLGKNQQLLAQSEVINLNALTFKNELEKQKGMVIDVRTPEEFAKGHLPNAINLNYLDPGFQQAIQKLNPDQPYFVYCAVGGRSAKACTQFKTQRFLKVYNLEGGITAWQKAGLATVK